MGKCLNLLSVTENVNKKILNVFEAYLGQSFSKYNFTLSCLALMPG